ncbi:MAG: PAS domain-containing sensor histidine kinase, partial [Rhodoferax sp.]
MPSSLPLSLLKPTKLPLLTRLKNWWQRLTPQRQDRFAVLAPLAAVVLFLAAIVAAFGYLRLEEIEREQEAVNRDVEYTQQRLRLRLLERQEQLMRIAREVSNRELDADDFQSRAEAIVNQYPELESLSWIDNRRSVKASFGSVSLAPQQLRKKGDTLEVGESVNSYNLARELQQPIYAMREASANAPAVLQLHI